MAPERVLAEAALEHTFVQGIASGELARATFAYYVGQDAAFLWGDNGEPQHLVVGAAVRGPFLCPLVRCFLLDLVSPPRRQSREPLSPHGRW